MKVVVFDFYSDLGHFKAPYTTTSPLTLPVPSKTAIYGIIGAIIGLDKDDYLKSFKIGSCKVAIQLNSPVRKTYISENLLNSKAVKMFARMNSHKSAPRTQIKFEMLKNPSFRLYIQHDNSSLMSRLEENLKSHKTEYSVSMGLSECLANFEYVDSCNICETYDNGFVGIDSLVPMELVKGVDSLEFDDELKILKDETVALLNAFGFETSTAGKYPAWKPVQSEFITKVHKIYKEHMPSSELEAIHAGLECAIFKEKYPNIQVCSIGPNIYFPHSNREECEISSVIKVYAIVKDIVKNS